MTDDDFDPYFKWMGIPPSEQPPNYYRLLGIPHYTFDEDVIENAADQRMNHLRSFQSGKNSAHSQRLLNEVAKAKVCLLNPEERAAYDKRLRRREAEQQEAEYKLKEDPQLEAAAASEQAAFVSPLSLSPSFDTAAKQKPRRQQKNPVVEAAKVIAGGVAGLAIGYVIMCYLNPGADFLGLMSAGNDPGSQVAENDPANDRLRQVPAPPVVVPPVPDPQPPQVNPTPVVPIGTPPEPIGNPPDPAPANNTPDPVTPEVPAEVPSPSIEPEPPSQSRLDQLQADRDAAIARADVRTTLRIIRDIAKLQEADPLTPQADALNAFYETGGDEAHFLTVGQEALTFAEAVIAESRADIAEGLKNMLLNAARKSANPELVRKATLVVVQLGEVGKSP